MRRQYISGKMDLQYIHLTKNSYLEYTKIPISLYMKLQIINAKVGKRTKDFYKRKETNLKKCSTSVQGNRSLNPQCGYAKTYPYLNGKKVTSKTYQFCGTVDRYRRRQWHPTPVLLPGESHERRSLVVCSPWGREESDTTERLHFPFSLSCIGGGNGNPLQCSCLKNPRDGGAWWAAVYGVAQSWT